MTDADLAETPSSIDWRRTKDSFDHVGHIPRLRVSGLPFARIKELSKNSQCSKISRATSLMEDAKAEICQQPWTVSGTHSCGGEERCNDSSVRSLC